ncbi:thioredoxin family protein [Bacillus tianshenii]|nr:thioredoxin family protein [Bacillus tianshenii]
MQPLHTIEEVDAFIQDNSLALIYITRPQCSVCEAMYPKVNELLERYSAIQAAKVNAAELTEISGKLSIFTVPVILLFTDGKEAVRKARFIPMEELEHDISKVYNLMN